MVEKAKYVDFFRPVVVHKKEDEASCKMYMNTLDELRALRKEWQADTTIGASVLSITLVKYDIWPRLVMTFRRNGYTLQVLMDHRFRDYEEGAFASTFLRDDSSAQRVDNKHGYAANKNQRFMTRAALDEHVRLIGALTDVVAPPRAPQQWWPSLSAY